MATRKGGRSAVASAGKRKRPIFGGADSDAVIKIDRRNPVTARKEETAKKAKAKKVEQAKIDAAVAKRKKKQKAERDAMMAKVKKDRPMPKRPSAISLANAADPKAKRPAKPQTPPTTSKVAAPTKQRIGTGDNLYLDDGRMNITKTNLKESGLGLTAYANYMKKNKKRPPKKAMGGGMMRSKMKAKGMKAGGKMKAKGMKAGGKMKAKGYKAGGKMKAKGYMAGGKMTTKMKPKGMKRGGKSSFPDLNKDGKVTQKDILIGRGVIKKKAGGKMKAKGYMAGGKMKSKGYSKGGKVRGAGIARKGVRPAKMF
jgi:hypothetical protein